MASSIFVVEYTTASLIDLQPFCSGVYYSLSDCPAAFLQWIIVQPSWLACSLLHWSIVQPLWLACSLSEVYYSLLDWPADFLQWSITSCSVKTRPLPLVSHRYCLWACTSLTCYVADVLLHCTTLKACAVVGGDGVCCCTYCTYCFFFLSFCFCFVSVCLNVLFLAPPHPPTPHFFIFFFNT